MILRATHLKKTFGPTTILDGADLEVKKGEAVAIVGPSGVGKSTLLNILGTLDTADSGTLELFGKSIDAHSHHLLRNQKIGFVFQSFNLLEDFTALENVLVPSWIGRKTVDGRKLLRWVGLEEVEQRLAKKLSGGEKQRVTIARALCNNPDLILADEPSGNLDGENAALVHDLLINAAKELGKSLIVVTHNRELAVRCDRTLTLKHGKLWTS